MASKVTGDMLKAFSGEGDLVAWLAKVKLVAKLQKISDLASFLPLYLEGDALALYLELSDAEQIDIDAIEKKLKEAFTDSAFIAFAKLSQKRWAGEQVDVYANELKRLGGLAGFTGVGLNRLVVLSFINGFPANISCELQQISGIFTMELSDVIARARVLTANKSDAVAVAAARPRRPTGREVALGRDTDNGRDRPSSRPFKEVGLEADSGRDGTGSRPFKGSCYRCGGPHMAKFCKERKELICFRCGKPGHMAANCNQENCGRVAGAPAVTHTEQ